MKIEPLAVPGAWVCSPQVYGDDRGSFAEWYRDDLLRAATGRRFEVVQANHSVSRRGVVRGVHFADVPPGQAKYVYCPVGAFVDIVVDLRVGSPTFGAVDSVRLDDADQRAVFIAEGIGHVLCALADGSSANYLVSTPYNPAVERTISPLDPALGLPLPEDLGDLVLSEKDAAAPTLEQAINSGILPTYENCLARYGELA
ncbi:MAG TPA: dTDP-4-dehydrorhamnose 3,5-epimerase [Mycobacteriales bacterium]|nr:dTDP-4-dehydrorhamnose 3,5-epimerase [Mycobacteriales bacterium]